MYQQLKEFKGKHVVTLNEGRDMGIINKVFLDPRKKRVAGITIKESRFGGEEKWVNIDKVEKLGEDFLFISREKDCQKKQPKGKSLKDLMGTQVTTRDGKILGYLVDVEVDDDWGVMELDLSGKKIVKLENGEAIFGEDAILLRAGAELRRQSEKSRHQGFLARVFGSEVAETANALSRAGKKQPSKERKSSTKYSLNERAVSRKRSETSRQQKRPD
jgi:uncharacterized protein YrrD